MLKIFYIGTGLLCLAIVVAAIWGVVETVDPIGQLQPVIKTDGLSNETVAALSLLLQCCGLGVIGIAALSAFSVYISLSGPRYLFYVAWSFLLFASSLVWGGEALFSALYGDWADARLLVAGLGTCWMGLILQFFGRKAFFDTATAQLTTASPIFKRIHR